jgi:hypothetical protein
MSAGSRRKYMNRKAKKINEVALISPENLHSIKNQRETKKKVLNPLRNFH